jgi:hypothetical protein
MSIYKRYQITGAIETGESKKSEVWAVNLSDEDLTSRGLDEDLTSRGLLEIAKAKITPAPILGKAAIKFSGASLNIICPNRMHYPNTYGVIIKDDEADEPATGFIFADYENTEEL